MAVNNDGEELPEQLTLVQLIRELVIALDKNGDIPVVVPNEKFCWTGVSDVTVKDDQVRILYDFSKE